MKILKNIIGQILAFFGVWLSADHGKRSYFEIFFEESEDGHVHSFRTGPMTKVCASSEVDEERNVLTVVTQLYCRNLKLAINQLGYIGHTYPDLVSKYLGLSGDVRFDIVHVQLRTDLGFMRNQDLLMGILRTKGLLTGSCGSGKTTSYVVLFDAAGPLESARMILIRRTYLADNPYFKLTEMVA